MNKEVRVRIAPSPTGHLHVGTARTALYNLLFARKQRGVYALRLEDTDIQRNKPEFEEEIYQLLDWLGLTPDESPKRGGPYAPYRDSERSAEHRAALKRLLDEGKAFYCPHGSREGERTVHWCEFRDGGATEGIIRFKPPRNRDITFQDLVHGEVTINTDTFGDFSIGRHLDSPLYNLAVTVDDALMEISHIIRGDDHIANTPKQILLQEALGYPSPRYGHLPLLLGTDRSKLSKRHGATAVAEFREQGYLPEALVNFLALLGWNPGGERELFSFEELIEAFSLEQVNKSGAIFDVAKLDWMNGEYIRRTSVSRLTELLLPFFASAGLDVLKITREQLNRIVELEQPRLKRLAEIGERVRFYFSAPSISPELLEWKKMDHEALLASLDESIALLSTFANDALVEDEIAAVFLAAAGKRRDRGELLWPLRAALSGLRASPGPFEIIAILGRDESLRRLKTAQDIVR